MCSWKTCFVSNLKLVLSKTFKLITCRYASCFQMVSNLHYVTFKISVCTNFTKRWHFRYCTFVSLCVFKLRNEDVSNAWLRVVMCLFNVVNVNSFSWEPGGYILLTRALFKGAIKLFFRLFYVGYQLLTSPFNRLMFFFC